MLKTIFSVCKAATVAAVIVAVGCVVFAKRTVR